MCLKPISSLCLAVKAELMMDQSGWVWQVFLHFSAELAHLQLDILPLWFVSWQEQNRLFSSVITLHKRIQHAKFIQSCSWFIYVRTKLQIMHDLNFPKTIIIKQLVCIQKRLLNEKHFIKIERRDFLPWDDH